VFNTLQRLGVPSRFVYFASENVSSFSLTIGGSRLWQHWVLNPLNSAQWHKEVFRVGGVPSSGRWLISNSSLWTSGCRQGVRTRLFQGTSLGISTQPLHSCIESASRLFTNQPTLFPAAWFVAKSRPCQLMPATRRTRSSVRPAVPQRPPPC
jgi:hypothetical protein